MSQPLGGPGLPLPPPTNLYPSELYNAPLDFPANRVVLSPGDIVPVPTGVQLVSPGDVSLLQFLDPLTGIWLGHDSARFSQNYIKSDGQNLRLANLTGCPVAAIVQNGGTGYLQGNTTVAPTVGNSVWQAIVGGQVSIVSMSNAGKNYSIAPIVLIQPPPMAQAANAPSTNNVNAPLGGVGGIPASAIANINSGGCVTSVSLVCLGAGYPSVPGITLLPSPNDPNYASITAATVVATLSNPGVITGVLCLNSGSPLSTISALTLTPAGSGSGATIGAVVMQCVTGGSVTTGGSGILPSGPGELSTVGGNPGLTDAMGTASYNLAGYRPRKASVGLVVNAGGCVTTIGAVYESGLFVGAPTPITSYQGGASVAPTLTLTLGSKTDTVSIQPAP